MDTAALALLLLRTDTSTDSGQGRGILQNFCCSQELAALDVLHKRRNVDVDGAALNTGRLGTVETALSLGHRHFLCQSDIDFFSASGGTIDGIQFWHLDTFNGSALLWFHRGTKLLAPLCIAVGE